MFLKSLMVAVAVVSMAAFGFQGDEKVKVRKKVEFISVDGEAGDGHVFVIKQEGDEPMHLQIDGQEMEIHLDDLEVGDTRIFETAEGQVTLARDEDGLVLTDEDGEQIRLFTSHDMDPHVIMEKAGDFEVKVLDATEFHSNDKVMISGIDGLSEEIQERVREALETAGVDKEVVFKSAPKMVWIDEEGDETVINGERKAIFIGDGSGDKKIKIIQKHKKHMKHEVEVEVDQEN